MPLDDSATLHLIPPQQSLIETMPSFLFLLKYTAVIQLLPRSFYRERNPLTHLIIGPACVTPSSLSYANITARMCSYIPARYFLTRALLAAENYVQAQEILRNEGFGAAEGFSVNMTFLMQEGNRMFHNAEVGPCEMDATQSQLSILTVSPGENTFHCNKLDILYIVNL